MNNRVAVYCLTAFCCLSTVSCSTIDMADSQFEKTAVKNQPNVLILMFDDMRFDSFSYRGGPVNTPNIDALAAQSTRFDNAMTTTGLCSPSRAAFFTGRWGHKTGLDDNVNLYHSRLQALNIAEGGLIKRATDEGYLVGYVGKWHIGPQGPSLRGAQIVKGHANSNQLKARPSIPYKRELEVARYKKGLLDKNGQKGNYYSTLEGQYEDTEAAKKVRDGQEMLRMAAAQNKPLLGVISFNQPHPPYRVPEPYASMYDPKKIEVPANHMIERVNKPLGQGGVYWPWHDVSHMTEMDWRKSRAFYYGAISMVDRAVGEIIQTARDLNLYDDLHIVLVGDQGSMIGEHSLYDKGPYAYDELMRIPLLIRKPNTAPRIVNRQVSLIDVAPTLAKWMALPNDGDVDGYSLTSLIEQGDEAMAGKPDTALYSYEWYNGSWHGIRAIRTPKFKFVWYPGDNRDELYDLENDPNEMNNLAAYKDFRPQLINLVRQLEKELIRVEDPALQEFRRQMNRLL